MQLVLRQWPEVYDSCHTFFARCASQKKHVQFSPEKTQTCENCTRFTCENCENCTRFTCDSRMSVCFLTCATCKNVLQNLIPRATAYWCSRAITSVKIQILLVFWNPDGNSWLLILQDSSAVSCKQQIIMGAVSNTYKFLNNKHSYLFQNHEKCHWAQCLLHWIILLCW